MGVVGGVYGYKEPHPFELTPEEQCPRSGCPPREKFRYRLDKNNYCNYFRKKID
jgi:hypothetical protein